MDIVLQLVERSNQRGGRMLSVIDLLQAGTLRRIVPTIHHYAGGAWREFVAGEPASPREKLIGEFLDECVAHKLYTVAQVRDAWLQWRDEQGSVL